MVVFVIERIAAKFSYCVSAQVINMVAHSSEFENIVIREEEQEELETLLRVSCPLEVKGGPTDKYGKISILIQVLAHLFGQYSCKFTLCIDLN